MSWHALLSDSKAPSRRLLILVSSQKLTIMTPILYTCLVQIIMQNKNALPLEMYNIPVSLSTFTLNNLHEK